MQYIRQLQSGIDVTPFLDEIAGVENAWGIAESLQETIMVQREAKAIPLRGLRKSCINGRNRRDVHESRWTTNSRKFPLARDFLQSVAEREGAILGRAKIVCLPAGKRVYPHRNRGEYYRLRARHHFVLQSKLGSYLRAGDEDVRMHAGELWWFDNDQVHEAMNDGKEDRIHMIFDLLPLTTAETIFGPDWTDEELRRAA